MSLFVTDEWEDGGMAQIILGNISDQPIEDWMLEFDSTLEITDLWGGVIESHEGEHYFIRNAEYAQNIPVGETWTVGMLFRGDAAEIRNVEARQIVVEDTVQLSDGILTVSKEHMTLNEYGNYELDADFSMFSGGLARADEVTAFTMQVYDKNDILIYETDIAPGSKWTVEDFAFIYGIDRFVFEVYFGTEHYAEELLIDCKTNYHFDKLNLDLEDNDSDGLQNYLEIYFGTDQNLTDTDNDGLTDHQELYTLGYDPCDPDTDGDGIMDCDEDEDEDGISNKAEYDMGANPISIDSDHDRLQDSVEFSYGTSLIDEDTDHDGISDYEEYTLDQMGASYNSSEGTYTAVFSAESMGIAYDKAVIPSVTVTGDVSAIMNFSTSMVTNNYYLNATMVGYMGQAYEFTTDGNMAGAELKFTYDERFIDEDTINAPDFCPAIYYFNADDGTLTEVENQAWSGNEVTAHLEHFSTYILANKSALTAFWNRPWNLGLYGTELSGIADGGVLETDVTNLDKGKLHLSVTDPDGNPVPGADVRIYHMDKCSANVMGGMSWECADPHSFLMKAKTDEEGKLECYLDAESSDYNGCYTILVDKDNRRGNIVNIGRMEWPRCLYYDGIAAGEDYDLNVVLEAYSAVSLKNNVSFQAYSNKPGEGILLSSKVRLHEGWDLIDFSDPAYEVQQSDGGWFSEIFRIDVPMGRYTAEFIKAGYPIKHMEILVTGNGQNYFAVMGEDDKIVDCNAQEIDRDVNDDGLDDELTKLICQGEITTYTGTTVFYQKNTIAWGGSYSEIMENSDWDNDGLRNGEEIEIYYKNGRYYIKMISHPQIRDSDYDMVFDNNEVNIYYTDPMKTEAIIYAKDLNDLIIRNTFESAKAYDAYLSQGNISLMAEYELNVVLCGGEASINKLARREMLDLFIKYTEQNKEDLELFGSINSLNSLLRGINDTVLLNTKAADL